MKTLKLIAAIVALALLAVFLMALLCVSSVGYIAGLLWIALVEGYQYAEDTLQGIGTAVERLQNWRSK